MPACARAVHERHVRPSATALAAGTSTRAAARATGLLALAGAGRLHRTLGSLDVSRCGAGATHLEYPLKPRSPPFRLERKATLKVN